MAVDELRDPVLSNRLGKGEGGVLESSLGIISAICRTCDGLGAAPHSSLISTHFTKDSS
jgi:hypothetical protein